MSLLGLSDGGRKDERGICDDQAGGSVIKCFLRRPLADKLFHSIEIKENLVGRGRSNLPPK